MTISEALKFGIQLLKESGNEAPGMEATVILSFATGTDRAFLYAHGETVLEARHKEMYLEGLQKRVSGMPAAYITGIKEFMSLEFFVNGSVLIPRPETELLVEKVLESAKRWKGKCLNILDIGTGSGCIAISIARYAKNCFVTAVDISTQALETARRNAEKNDVSERMVFIKGSLYEELRDSKYDIIVSNPPYIPSEQITSLGREVGEYEPVEALDGGRDGLFYLKEIISKAPGFLKEEGLLAVEIGLGQAERVSGIMKRFFEEVAVLNDLQGIARVVTGFNPGIVYNKQ